ncbi:hypothetical protein HOF40_04985 [Candidatus Parcubacteria bacterium]|nr:hypothetical protein [Candidatus Parcubacteria bacterium]
MRIYIASDLHLGTDPRGDRSAANLAAHLTRVSNPEDVLMLLGDYAQDDQGVERCLNMFNGFRGTKMAVLGNHDLWVKRDGRRTSLERREQLHDMFSRNDFHPLEREAVVIGDIGFVGITGWYDYSFGDAPGIPFEAYQTKTYPKDGSVRWGDARFIRWDHTDEEVTQQQANLLDDQIKRLTAHGARKVIVGMHHVPSKALLPQPRWLVPHNWRFLKAFLGSDRFERVVTKHAGIVSNVVCGHIHRTAQANIQGTTYTAVGGDYTWKQLVAIDGGGQVLIKNF